MKELQTRVQKKNYWKKKEKARRCFKIYLYIYEELRLYILLVYGLGSL